MAVCDLTMRSTVLQMDVNVKVFIPESRKSYKDDPVDKKYKCLYILHGTKEDAQTWFNLSNLLLMVRELDLFVVCPSAYNTCYVDTTFGMKMQEYISEELPAKMERIFPISSAREDRYIMGESMGGYGTWLTTLTHPEKYGKAAPLSQGGFREFKHVLDTGAHSVDKLAKAVSDNAENVPPTEYFLMCGTDDMLISACHEWMDYLHKECPNIHVQEEYWPGKHDFFFWNQAIPKALRFFGFDIDPSRVTLI